MHLCNRTKLIMNLSEFILLEHLSFIIVGHHPWYQTYHLIKTMIQTPRQKIPPSICWTWEILPPILPLKLPWPRKGDSPPREKNCRGSVVCFFFLFFLVGKTTSNKPSNSFFFWKKCPTRPTIRVPAFLGLFFFFGNLRKNNKKQHLGYSTFFLELII